MLEYSANSGSNDVLIVSGLLPTDFWALSIVGRCMLSKYFGHGNSIIEVTKLPIYTMDSIPFSDEGNLQITMNIKSKNCRRPVVETYTFGINDNPYFQVEPKEITLYGVDSYQEIHVNTSLDSIEIDDIFDDLSAKKNYEITKKPNTKGYFIIKSINNEPYLNDKLPIKCESMQYQEFIYVSQLALNDDSKERTIRVIPSHNEIVVHEKDSSVTIVHYNVLSYPKIFRLDISDDLKNNITINNLDYNSGHITLELKGFTKEDYYVLGTITNDEINYTVDLELNVVKKTQVDNSFGIVSATSYRSKITYNADGYAPQIIKDEYTLESDVPLSSIVATFQSFVISSDEARNDYPQIDFTLEQELKFQYDNSAILGIESNNNVGDFINWYIKEFDNNDLIVQKIPSTVLTREYDLQITLLNNKCINEKKKIVLSNNFKEIVIWYNAIGQPSWGNQICCPQCQSRYIFFDKSTYYPKSSKNMKYWLQEEMSKTSTNSINEDKEKSTFKYQYFGIEDETTRINPSSFVSVYFPNDVDDTLNERQVSYSIINNGTLFNYKLCRLNENREIEELNIYEFNFTNEQIYIGDLPQFLNDNTIYLYSSNPYVPKTYANDTFVEEIIFKQNESNGRTFKYYIIHEKSKYNSYQLQFIKDEESLSSITTVFSTTEITSIMPTILSRRIDNGINYSEDFIVSENENDNGDIVSLGTTSFSANRLNDNQMLTNYTVTVIPNKTKNERHQTIKFKQISDVTTVPSFAVKWEEITWNIKQLVEDVYTLFWVVKDEETQQYKRISDSIMNVSYTDLKNPTALTQTVTIDFISLKNEETASVMPLYEFGTDLNVRYDNIDKNKLKPNGWLKYSYIKPKNNDEYGKLSFTIDRFFSTVTATRTFKLELFQTILSDKPISLLVKQEGQPSKQTFGFVVENETYNEFTITGASSTLSGKLYIKSLDELGNISNNFNYEFNPTTWCHFESKQFKDNLFEVIYMCDANRFSYRECDVTFTQSNNIKLNIVLHIKQEGSRH